MYLVPGPRHDVRATVKFSSLSGSGGGGRGVGGGADDAELVRRSISPVVSNSFAFILPQNIMPQAIFICQKDFRV
jgi:hypothetical protein